MFFQELPEIVERSLYFKHYDAAEAKMHVEVAEDQEAIRDC